MGDRRQLYFGRVRSVLKTLATGMKMTMREYFIPKSTGQCPENRKTTLHVTEHHRGRLVFKHNEEKDHKCAACTMCEKAYPNGTIEIPSGMVTNEETGKKKKQLVDCECDLGDCMLRELCINAYNFGVIEFTSDFENVVSGRSKLVLHLGKEVYRGGSLPGLIDGDMDWKVGTFDTKKR